MDAEHKTCKNFVANVGVDEKLEDSLVTAESLARAVHIFAIVWKCLSQLFKITACLKAKLLWRKRSTPGSCVRLAKFWMNVWQFLKNTIQSDMDPRIDMQMIHSFFLRQEVRVRFKNSSQNISSVALMCIYTLTTGHRARTGHTGISGRGSIYRFSAYLQVQCHQLWPLFLPSL